MTNDQSRFIANYDREIQGDFARSFYGDSGFYNIGFWEDIARKKKTSFVAACIALVNHMAAVDSAAEKADCRDLLDVGCGLGATTACLAGLYDRAAIHGINLSEAQIKASRRRCPQGLFQVMDATKLTFPDASFDRIFCVEAMFYFETRATFLAEAARVLRPGGRLIVTDALYRRCLGLQFPKCNLGTDPGIFSPLAEEAGLHLRTAEDITADTLAPYIQIVREAGHEGWARLVKSAITSYHYLVFERP
ncbi:methyltransferase domain-containing protein [Kordiimonas aestuarii]|uniref:methyltransferase domain-containing protein n=1 Tax=Kordiimonas aestuarii TaxID=1005925 RepID=UPI0021CE0E8E|nr:methyltransferase domain-containing protein [Kordiimonas aestuarii]